MAWTSEPIPGGWAYKNGKAEITLDYILPRGTIYEAWVECRLNDTEIPLASGTTNISSPSAARAFLTALGESDINWAEGLRQAFYETIEAERDAISTVDLAIIEPGDQLFVLDPLVESGGNTRLIAPGESGKSLLADAVACTVATGDHRYLGLKPQVVGPVLYLDWETNADTHARRWRALAAPLDLPAPDRELIHYRQESRPLWRSIQAVERAATRVGAVLVIVDSRVPAAGPSGQSSGEESTINLHLALREIGRPALIIDHKSQEKIAKNVRGGYGNIFNDNLARMVWEFTSISRPTASSSQFLLELTKGNNVGSIPPIGYRLETHGGKKGITSARFTQVNPEVVREAEDETVGDRVDSLFTTSTEFMTIRRMAEITGFKENTIRSFLAKSGRYFNRNEGKKGKAGLWGPTEEWQVALTDEGAQDPLPEPPPLEDGVY